MGIFLIGQIQHFNIFIGRKLFGDHHDRICCRINIAENIQCQVVDYSMKNSITMALFA